MHHFPWPAPWQLTLALALSLCTGGCCVLHRQNDQLVAAREHSRQAMFAIHRGNLEEAHVRYEHALKAAPDDGRVHHGYAKLLWSRGEHATAIEHMQQALELCGNDPGWNVELGEMFLAENQIDQALECAEIAINRDREDAVAWLLRADAMRASLQTDDARKSYFRALDCEGCDPRALVALAELYRVQGQPRRALSALQRLESNYPATQHPTQLAFLQGVALQALGRHDAAIDKFVEARDKLGDQPETLLLLAESQFQLGQIKDAKTNATRAAQHLQGDARVADLTKRINASGDRVATF
ncbi:MAG: tetratricopeptide repeat protein [Planctomycetota bacterium]